MQIKNPTIKEIFEFGINFLNSHKIESAAINTEQILCWILNLSRIELRLKYNEIIAPQHKQKFFNALESRANHIPLQYIIGKINFNNIILDINESVLIPRPETEELTELISNRIQSESSRIRNILDIGTGSGCISIVLATQFPDIKIDGIDISSSAVRCANENKNRLNLENISFINIDFARFCSERKYDIIVSNPPYISLNDYKKLPKELFFEPKIALTDDKDGLSFYRLIAERADKILNRNGRIFLECGVNQAQQISFIFNENQFRTQIIKDFSGIDRFIIACSNEKNLYQT